MENLLIKYMNERFEKHSDAKIEPGPVITISRECGCSGVLIGEMLAERINNDYRNRGIKKEWKVISKEILSLASQKLKVHPDQMHQLINSDKRGMLQDMVASFTDKYYINSSKVNKVVQEVIRNFGIEGYSIIVGRGSSEITFDINNSLHVCLEAPLAWRINRIVEKHGYSPDVAKKYTIEVDKDRSKLRDYFKIKEEIRLYRQLTLNCKELTNDQICDIIIYTAKIRGII